jgi:enoyl-CoA hydratase
LNTTLKKDFHSIQTIVSYIITLLSTSPSNLHSVCNKMSSIKISSQHNGQITIITLHRPNHRNAVDGKTAQELYTAFINFDKDEQAKVAILHGEGGVFCSGADLSAIAAGDTSKSNPMIPVGSMGSAHEIGPMGCSRLTLSKPVIASISGYAVAGGIELACWCDLRVCDETAVFGVFCRRFGVPLIDGGTIRLPRLIGQSRAMDMILTGRPVDAKEALQIGLANRVVPKGKSLEASIALAKDLCDFPQVTLRNDRLSALNQWSLPLQQALQVEFQLGMGSLLSGSSSEGAKKFKSGVGKGGQFNNNNKL